MLYDIIVRQFRESVRLSGHFLAFSRTPAGCDCHLAMTTAKDEVRTTRGDLRCWYYHISQSAQGAPQREREFMRVCGFFVWFSRLVVHRARELARRPHRLAHTMMRPRERVIVPQKAASTDVVVGQARRREREV